MQALHDEIVLVVDFGSQYTQLIARRVREANVFCEIVPFDAPESAFTSSAIRGFILSGGPESVTGVDGFTPRIPPAVLTSGLPVLGICYGLQALMQALGGRVEGSEEREFGHAELVFETDASSGPLAALRAQAGATPSVWMSHGDRVIEVAPEFDVLARSHNGHIAAVAHRKRPWFGLQFHPEVTHSQGGSALLSHFVRQVCGTAGEWTSAHIAEALTQELAEQLGDDRVVLGLSGGVDSSVVAALLHRAIGDRLTCLFVDTGLLRLHEGDEVERAFAARSNELPLNVVRIDAHERFLSALAGVSDPEDKRKIIGRTFVDVFQEQAGRLADVKWLAQGTIYPDVIESAASKYGKAHVIKSHHNVGGLPETLHLKLVEPLRELFKDEVRQLGRTLGLPAHFIDRHPFPGPGLGVRILGEVKEEYADALRRADAIFLEELRVAGWYEQTSQAFAVFLPVKSVGVVGDARRFAHVIALRAVTTTDFMTADWARLPYDLVARVSNRIVNEIDSVSRVVYDVSSKPPATIEWE